MAAATSSQTLAGKPLVVPDGDPRDLLGLAGPDAGSGPLGPLAGLVRLALEDDDSCGLVAAAAAELGRPLGLVALTGEELAYAPEDVGGRRALAVAGAVVRKAEASPLSGWRVLPVAPGHARRAVLAVGGAGAAAGPLLDLIVALLGEQLLRAGLQRDQTAAFLRRLVSEPGIGAQRAREEAAGLGMTLLDAYWPAVVAWWAGAPGSDALGSIEREARRLAPGGLTATANGYMVLLHPADERASDVIAWVERVVARGRAIAPSVYAQAVAGDEAVALGELSDHVTRLARLCGYGPRAESAQSVARARQYALEALLRESVAPAEARLFVDKLLGVLIAWDREHRSDLLRVLEAALDSPRQDVAARRCFMHRNTFRHRLHKALHVLGDDLAEPEMRLAVHVALKLHRATASGVRGGAVAARRRAKRPGHTSLVAATPSRARPAGARRASVTS